MSVKWQTANRLVSAIVSATKAKQLFVVLLMVLASGCTTTRYYAMQVNAISNTQQAAGKHYLLRPADNRVDPQDLQFKEFASYTDEALRSMGYSPAKNLDKADMVILLGYGVGEPQVHQELYTVPSWGQAGFYTQQHVQQQGDNKTYTTTTYIPRYGFTGSEVRAETYVSYKRYLYLDAISVQAWKNKTRQQLWKTTVTSYGSSGDLRQIFPILIAASKSYFGMDSGKMIHIRMPENDPRILQFTHRLKSANSGQAATARPTTLEAQDDKK